MPWHAAAEHAPEGDPHVEQNAPSEVPIRGAHPRSQGKEKECWAGLGTSSASDDGSDSTVRVHHVAPPLREQPGHAYMTPAGKEKMSKCLAKGVLKQPATRMGTATVDIAGHHLPNLATFGSIGVLVKKTNVLVPI